jgi:hypothetical protein
VGRFDKKNAIANHDSTHLNLEVPAGSELGLVVELFAPSPQPESQWSFKSQRQVAVARRGPGGSLVRPVPVIPLRVHHVTEGPLALSERST